MKTIAEIRVEALGGDTSMRDVVHSAREVLMRSGLQCETHPLGTNVEGEMATVLRCVEEIHRRLHEQGLSRLSTHLRLGTRTDHARGLDDDEFDGSKLPEVGEPLRLA